MRVGQRERARFKHECVIFSAVENDYDDVDEFMIKFRFSISNKLVLFLITTIKTTKKIYGILFEQ